MLPGARYNSTMPDPIAPDHATPPATGYPDQLPRRRPGRQPLPDAQAIRSMTVPEIAPPYDDLAAARAPKHTPTGVSGPGQVVALPARPGQPRAAPSAIRSAGSG